MQDFLPLITGGTGAIVVLALVAWAFYAGKLHYDRDYSKLEAENEALRAENSQYRLALETERKTVNETASAGSVTNQLINALAAIATERAELAREAARPGGLTAEDVGL